MELIEGETLAARIEKGAIPLDQAIKFATQIADALDRAHRAGVTHRDVKVLLPNISKAIPWERHLRRIVILPDLA